MFSFEKIWRLKGRVFCIAVLTGMAVWSFWSWRHVRYQADAFVAVQISSNVSANAGVLSLAKKITSYSQIEKVAHLLNRVKNEEKTVQDQQREIQILQSKIEVTPRSGTGMILIRAEDLNPSFALRLANEVARKAAEITEASLENNPEAKIKWNEAQIKTGETKIQALEKEIFNFKRKWSWETAKAGTESQIMAKRGERSLFLEKYTSRHPEILRIDEEIAVLQKELTDGNFNSEEIEVLEAQLKKEKEDYAQSAQLMEQAQFEQVSQPAAIRLVSTATVAHKTVQMPSLPIILLALLFSLCAGVVIAVLTGSNRLS